MFETESHIFTFIEIMKQLNWHYKIRQEAFLILLLIHIVFKAMSGR